MQSRASRRLLAGVSRIHGQEKDLFMDDHRLCGARLHYHHYLDIHHMPSPGAELVSWPSGARLMTMSNCS